MNKRSLSYDLNHTFQQAYRRAIASSQSLCMAVFSADSTDTVSENPAFTQISGGLGAQSLMNPSFEQLLNLPCDPDWPESPIFKGFITLGPDNLKATSLNACVYRNDTMLLLLAELDVQRMARQNQAMNDLNREVNHLQRKLTREKKQLQHTLEELRQANEQLIVLNEEKNRFLNMAAHDLRNPISTAISCTEILLEAPDLDGNKKTQLLQTARDRMHFAVELMSELLDISRMEADKVSLKLDTYDYINLLNKVTAFNQLVARYKKISIHLHHPPEPVSFRFDRNKIEQVLNNLISNAIKFSHNGSRIDIGVDVSEANNNAPSFITTTVTDYGIGIPENEQHLLFQPFQKTSSRPTAGESSTGLGLAIAQKIIREHKGEILVSSRPEEGSRFSVRVPANL